MVPFMRRKQQPDASGNRDKTAESLSDNNKPHTRTVQFEGVTHEFPGDATDAEISSALDRMSPAGATRRVPMVRPVMTDAAPAY